MKKLRRLLFKYLFRFVLAFIVLSHFVVVPFRWLNPPVTMVMADRWLNTSNDDFKLRQQWLSWDDMPKHAALAVVTSEDQLFLMHHGFDVDAIMSVLKSSGSDKP